MSAAQALSECVCVCVCVCVFFLVIQLVDMDRFIMMKRWRKVFFC